MALIGFQGVENNHQNRDNIALFTFKKTGVVTVMISISNLIDERKCYQMIRELRWLDGVICPHCQSPLVKKRGFHTTCPHRQRYCCQSCQKQFDDVSSTLLAGHHQPVKVWVLCLYLMGLNLSNQQIAAELSLNLSDVQQMTTHLREGIVEKKKCDPHRRSGMR